MSYQFTTLDNTTRNEISCLSFDPVRVYLTVVVLCALLNLLFSKKLRDMKMCDISSLFFGFLCAVICTVLVIKCLHYANPNVAMVFVVIIGFLIFSNTINNMLGYDQ